MTAIAAVAENGRVWIGGDSAGVSGWDMIVRSDSKVFKNGPFLFGFTTSFRMGQLLRFSFTPPSKAKRISDYEFMVTAVVDEVRKCLKNGGWATKDREQESGGTFIIGFNGQIYVIYSDYQVEIPRAGFAAVGCGAQVIYGALFATKSLDARSRIQISLKAAEQFSAGVRGPFVVIHS